MSVTSTSVERLLDPQTIAIVGLSSDPAKHGRRVLEHLRNHGFRGEIWGVNPKLPAVEGVDVFASVGELPDAPDVLVLTVPAAAVPDVVAESAGVGVAIVFAGGFAEAGNEGAILQNRLVAAARTSGVRLLGPNSGGVIQPGCPISFLTCLDRPVEQLRSGPVGLVTQSGGTGSYLHNLAAAKGSGFAVSISTGNEVDLEIADGIAALADRKDVDVIAVVLETIRDGSAFIDAVRRAHRAGKRVVACRFGTTARGQSMLQTHTAALAHPHRVLDGVLHSLGVPNAETPAELLEIAEVLAHVGPVSASNVGIVTHSGGVAILLADLCDRHGVSVTAPSAELVARVTPLLEQGAVGNPLDMGGIIGGQHRFAEVVTEFAGHYDVVLAVSSAHPPAHSEERVKSLRAIETPTPIVHLWMAGDVAVEALHALRLAGAPVTEEPRAAVRALAALTTPSHAVPDTRPKRSPQIPTPRTEHAAKQLLASWGITVPPGRHATSVEAAIEAADRIGYPLAVKVSVPGGTHKTEIGGVELGVATAAELRTAFERVVAAAVAAGEHPHGVLVEAMVDGPEAIVAAVRNPAFGPMVLVGLGGVHAEALNDAAMALAPLTEGQAFDVIQQMDGLPVLTAPRTGAPADLEELAAVVATVGDLLVRHPDLGSIEINPLTWSPAGWRAIDAVVV